MSEIKAILEELAEVSGNPRKQMEKYLSAGKKVVGCFPVYTPEELVHAGGMIPMGLWGGQITPSVAGKYNPIFTCSIMRSCMEYGMTGVYEGLTCAVMPMLCDTFRGMSAAWRSGVKDIPLVSFIHPQNRTDSDAFSFLVEEYRAAAKKLEEVTGCTITEESLAQSIEVYNEHSATMMAFAKAANDHLDVITPKVRHVVHKSAFFFEKGEHTALVQEIIAGLKELPAHHWTGNKIILAGILCEPEEVLDILEENQLAVVADDLAQESRQYRTDTPEKGGGALKRLALQWNARYGCSLIHELGKPRGKMLAKMCQETGAQGVISCMMKFCDPEEYDEPYLEADLRKAGIHVMNIDIDPLNHSYEQVRTRVQSFCEML